MLLIAAGALTVVALILLVFAPAWGVLGIFIARPLVDATWESRSVLAGMSLTEIISGLAPVLVLPWMLASSDLRKSFSRMPMRFMWLLWSADVLLFSLYIMTVDGIPTGVSVLFRHWSGLIGFYMVQAWFAAEQRLVRRFAIALLIAGIFPVSTGLYEAVTGFHWTITMGEDNVIRNVGLYHDAITIRYYALQTIMAVLLLHATEGATEGVAGGTRSSIVSSLSWAYAACAAFILFKAYSKSGTFTLLSWGLLWLLLLRKYRALTVAGIAAVILAGWYGKEVMDAGGFIFQKELGAIAGTADSHRAFNGRFYHWIELLDQWNELPVANQIFGSGHIATGAHNDYIQVMFHGGYIGLTIYVTLLIRIMVRVAGDLRRRRDAYSVAALLAMIMWLVDTIGLVPSAYSGYQWFVWGVVGLCLRRREDELRPAAVAATTPVDVSTQVGSASTMPARNPLLLPVPPGRTFLQLPAPKDRTL
jgi:hypothetical protein